MMDFDLRANKLQKQSDARILEAKKKRERELLLQKEQRLREEKLRIEREELARIAAEREQMEFEKKLEEEQLLFQKSGGILFELTHLIPFQIEGEDDKVILPESCITILDSKNAFYSGPLHFEISCSMKPNITTHCGMREFSADEGTIGLPKKVITSLLQKENTVINDIGTINISYRKLNKIKSTKFAPHSDSFFSLYQHNIKNVLEQNLKLHACLTVGDILNVWFRGKSFYLTVVEILPERYGSLIDTDVEIDFVNLETSSSLLSNTSKSNYSSQIVSETKTIAASSLSSSSLPVDKSNMVNNGFYKLSDTSSSSSSSSSSAAVASLKLPSPSTITTVLSNDNNNNNNNHLMQLDDDDDDDDESFSQHSLPPEPPTQEIIDIIQFRFRLIDGTITTRRFYKSQKIMDLFHFVSRSVKMPVKLLQLSSSSINRVFTYREEEEKKLLESLTLDEIGFSKRELLVVSLLTVS